MGPGEPTFAVYYDNTKNVLAFHDPLTGVASGPITYLVTGWFSEPTRDPLHAPSTESAWHATFKELGWSLSVGSLERLDAAAREFLRAQRELGLKSKEEESGPVFRSAPSSTSTKAGETSKSAAAEPTVRIGSATSRISKALGADVLVSRQRYFEQHWPRQLLCHGAVFDVAWNGRGGGFDTADAGVPRADRVKVAIGNSGAQALGALIARPRATQAWSERWPRSTPARSPISRWRAESLGWKPPCTPTTSLQARRLRALRDRAR